MLFGTLTFPAIYLAEAFEINKSISKSENNFDASAEVVQQLTDFALHVEREQKVHLRKRTTIQRKRPSSAPRSEEAESERKSPRRENKGSEEQSINGLGTCSDKALFDSIPQSRRNSQIITQDGDIYQVSDSVEDSDSQSPEKSNEPTVVIENVSPDWEVEKAERVLERQMNAELDEFGLEIEMPNEETVTDENANIVVTETPQSPEIQPDVDDPESPDESDCAQSWKRNPQSDKNSAEGSDKTSTVRANSGKQTRAGRKLRDRRKSTPKT